jgi:hypothetical protein
MAPVLIFFFFLELFWVTFCNVCWDGLVVGCRGSICVGFGGHGCLISGASFPMVHKLGKTISNWIGDIFFLSRLRSLYVRFPRPI